MKIPKRAREGAEQQGDRGKDAPPALTRHIVRERFGGQDQFRAGARHRWSSGLRRAWGAGGLDLRSDHVFRGYAIAA